MSVPLVKNKVAQFVKEMCKDAVISGNHSLRPTGVAAMFAAGVPEKSIKSMLATNPVKL